MKTVLIDDEHLARKELKHLLKVHPEIEIVGEAANVTEALHLLPALRPDLIFLDIEMPVRNGFDLLAALPAPHPQVIFVTAYDAFAVRAFQVNALDYLLKPVEPERLAEALARVERNHERAGDEPSSEKTPTHDPETPFKEDDRVFVREGDRCWFVPVREITLLEAEGNHTRVHLRGERPLLRRSLALMETRLPASLFVRANRGQLINRTCIEKVEPWFSGGLKATLRNGVEVEFSRRQAQEFRERLEL
ncbi:MAG: response regulator transcription factor [Opitutus sp.]|nr:response regulator transcription factor [Opitutus sp.]MCS6248180.1 response regulator transcription factor [Opitutus sp.]MCS6273442.1 response regulator transcription factor [Opitutus sp.]MCS6276960.1 response regulator transcription factor [Opitutus sp.]MCS6299992.1 response regulator transcription factor [Opitutus sp.]